MEVLDNEGNFLRKADMFSKRTIKKKEVITSVDTASEALALSLAEKAKVDMSYMMELTHKPEEEILSDLKGVIFLNPEYDENEDIAYQYLAADEYLSGNVREKLRIARALADRDDRYAINAQSLEAVQPVDLTASEISVRLGATWLPTDVVQDFMFSLLGTPRYQQCESRVEFTEQNGKHCECNTAKDMQEQALRRAHFGSGLNICQVAKPIEERFDGLPHRAYKCRHGVPSEKCVAALLLSGCPNLHAILLL